LPRLPSAISPVIVLIFARCEALTILLLTVTPAATKDLSLYAEMAPSMLRYDLRQKRYVFAGGQPYFSHDVEQALFSLSGDRAIALDSEHTKRLPSWVDCSIKRKVPMPIVATITRCMYQGRRMKAEYGSHERCISPLALVHDGLRWHVRCFDHDHNEYRDYNLTRFKSACADERSEVTLAGDKEWNMEVELQLSPHPKALHPETIRLDYDIVGNVKNVVLRACLVGYFLRHWHIDFTDNASADPGAHQLFLQNKRELAGQVPECALEPESKANTKNAMSVSVVRAVCSSVIFPSIRKSSSQSNTRELVLLRH
jgi:hypothetical protein